MDPKAARPIIDALAQGLHPVTREVLPDESAFNIPGVILALHLASGALARVSSDEALKKKSAAAPNTGKRWLPEDDAALVQAHAADPDLKRLGAAIGRTPFAVEQRLVRLGRLAPPAGGGRYGPRPPAAGAN